MGNCQSTLTRNTAIQCCVQCLQCVVATVLSTKVHEAINVAEKSLNTSQALGLFIPYYSNSLLSLLLKLIDRLVMFSYPKVVLQCDTRCQQCVGSCQPGSIWWASCSKDASAGRPGGLCLSLLCPLAVGGPSQPPPQFPWLSDCWVSPPLPVEKASFPSACAFLQR